MLHCPLTKQFCLALHSEVCFCFGMANSSKSTFPSALRSTRSRFWDSHYHPTFPYLYPINYQESCIFLFLLQGIRPLHIKEECLEAHCNPNNLFSTQFRANFLYTKIPALWVCTFLEDEMSIHELSHP